MKFRMYGFSENYKELFSVYKQTGIQSVVSGKNNVAMKVAKESGLKYYICTGAYGTSDEKEHCQSITGERTSWFRSGCSNHLDLRERSFKRAEDTAKLPDLNGIIIDGARFASPESIESMDAFFTCFCPRCMAKMDSLGFDSQEIKLSVSAFYHLIKHNKPFKLQNHISNLKDWLTFRRLCVTEFLTEYIDRIKTVNQDIETGIYIFSPSLSDLVGQSYRDISSIVDFISPMIYRHYKYPQGPACLDHEIAAISGYFEEKDDEVKSVIIDTFKKLTGVDYSIYGTREQLLKEGLPPEVVVSETKKAAFLSGDCPVIPIILLDDVNLENIIVEISDVVNEIDFFAYNDPVFAQAKPVLEKYR